MSTGDKMPWSQGMRIANMFMSLICFEAHDIVAAGSLRRLKAEIGDIEVVCRPNIAIVDGKPRNYLDEQLEDLLESNTFTKALYRTRIGKNGEPDKFGNRWGSAYKGLQFDHKEMGSVKIEVFIGDEHNYGYTLALRTGPGDGNRTLMTKLGRMDTVWHFKEGYARLKEDGRIIKVPKELNFFNLIGHPYIEPKDRKDELYDKMRLNPKKADFDLLSLEETKAIDKAK